MKTHRHIKYAILPILASSALTCGAEPLLLNTADMDRVTAGADVLVERFATVSMATFPLTNSIGRWSAVTPNQLASVAQLLTAVPGSLRQITSSDLAGAYELRPGEYLVIFKQPSQNNSVSPAQSSLVQSVPGQTRTYEVKPGETLQIQQWSTGGNNYAYLRSSGSGIAGVLSK